MSRGAEILYGDHNQLMQFSTNEHFKTYRNYIYFILLRESHLNLTLLEQFPTRAANATNVCQ